MINESNQDIDNLVKHLRVLIDELKKNYPKSEVLKKLMKFHQTIVATWMEKFVISGVEPNIIEDEELKNQILDWIIEIRKILHK